MDEVYRPVAREAELLVEPVDDELLVFDSERQIAHSLNRVAAAVWRACDGSRTVDEIADATGCKREAVELALVELANIELLAGERPAVAIVSRRQMLRRTAVVGAAAGLALPVIRSITAPSPALAASGCGKVRQPCCANSTCSRSSTGNFQNNICKQGTCCVSDSAGINGNCNTSNPCCPSNTCNPSNTPGKVSCTPTV
jgi:hypothetical protein